MVISKNHNAQPSRTVITQSVQLLKLYLLSQNMDILPMGSGHVKRSQSDTSPIVLSQSIQFL